MKLEPRETWAGKKITYKKTPTAGPAGGTTYKEEKIETDVKEQAKSANTVINPHEVEAAVKELKECIKEQVNGVRNILEGFAACDLAASLTINNSITYRSILEDAAEDINHTSGLEELKSKATETQEKAVEKHDSKQREFNEEAKSNVQSKSDTDVKCVARDTE